MNNPEMMSALSSFERELSRRQVKIYVTITQSEVICLKLL